MRIIGVIPARFSSTRLPGKPLADICGRPMVWHVYQNARTSHSLEQVIVATDDRSIADVVEAFGGTAMMTGAAHASGTDRVAEVARRLAADILVNIQGDEPLMEASIIDECVGTLTADPAAQMSTVMKRIGESSYHDPGVVKVVCDLEGRALYFSRSLLPYPRNQMEGFGVYEHLGIYAYRKECLLTLAQLRPTPLERIEGLEQLRALEHGIPIHVVETKHHAELVSVDTQHDLERVREIVAARKKIEVRA